MTVTIVVSCDRCGGESSETLDPEHEVANVIPKGWSRRVINKSIRYLCKSCTEEYMGILDARFEFDENWLNDPGYCGRECKRSVE